MPIRFVDSRLLDLLGLWLFRKARTIYMFLPFKTAASVFDSLLLAIWRVDQGVACSFPLVLYMVVGEMFFNRDK